MSEWMFCPICGSRLAPDDTGCRACGSALPDATTVTSGEAAATTSEDLLKRLTEELREALAPNYLLIKRLGEGGMGSVFLARDPALKRMVAVKVLSREFAVIPEARKRFEREAEAVAAISHLNVISVYGVGSLADGTPYFVMQYVDGGDLAQVLEEDGILDNAAASRILGAVASGLAAAHKSGVIHRDIKPANILLDETGTVFVSDFGIAAIDDSNRERTATKLTSVGMSIGTPAFMSPEQLTADEITTATDIYSLGVMGFEMVAGRPPFVGSTPQELIAAKLRDPVPRLSKLERSVTPEYEEIVNRCLTTEPSIRPTAIDVAEHLSRAVTSDQRTKWVGTALLVAMVALIWVTVGARWVIATTESVYEAWPTDREANEFLHGVSFAAINFLRPVGILAAFFLALCIAGLLVHLRRLGLKHRNFGKTIKFGFALPGPWGIVSIGFGAVVLVVVPLISVIPVLQLISASVDLTLPLSMRLYIHASLFMQNWWARLPVAVVVLYVGMLVWKRPSQKTGARATSRLR
jgi:hypothetical protein